jgi:alginate O-acetyltransferase complex protein AlgI
MHVTMLPVFLCTVLLVCLSPFLYKRVSARYVLLFFSVGCFAFISTIGVAILLLFSVIVYAGGRTISRTSRCGIYYGTIALCLLGLVLFKIIGGHPELLVADGHVPLQIIGISYFTFNGLSYLFDIRRGYLEPERNYGHLLLYLSFFPCIAAGPLHRYKYLQAQFSNALNINGEDLSRGFRLLLWGLFKNLVLAQRLKAIADPMLDDHAAYHGFFVLLGGLAFFFQLYCDFSGYVDVSMGFARMLGVQLSPNFSNRVYASPSRTDFWKGWHQTLNTWFRDYLFFPLVKGRAKKKSINLMLLLTFILIGLWHDISWRFLLWGLLNGLWIIAETKIRTRLPKVSSRFWQGMGVLYHLSFASCMAVIFRTNDLLASWQALFSANKQQFSQDAMGRKLIFVIPLLLAMDQVNRAMKNDTIDLYLGRQKRYHRWLFYFVIGLVIMAFGHLPGEGHYYMKF